MIENDETHSMVIRDRLSLHRKRRKLNLREHKIDIKNQFIKINKNQINFSSLSNQIKYIFVQAYKKCVRWNCFCQIFYEMDEMKFNKQSGICIYIMDNDGIKLIKKMYHLIHIKQLQMMINKLKLDRQKCEQKLKYLNDTLPLFIHKMQQIKMLRQQIQNIQKYENTCFQQLQKKINSIQKTIQKLLLQKYKYQQQINKYQQQILLNNQSILFKQSLQKTINKLSRNLILQSILMIVQPNQSPILEVYIIYQQSYKTTKISKKNIIKLIGTQAYLQKLRKFNDLINQDHISSQFKQLMCCHNCMSLCNSQKLYFCNQKINKKLTQGYQSTDYFLYRHTVIQSNFFNKDFSNHVLSYFKYYKNQNGQLSCNRAYCQTCLESYYKTDLENFQCPYCNEGCNCKRCQLGVNIVQLIAHDYVYDPHQQRNYHNILNLVNSQQSKYANKKLELRSVFNSNQWNLLVEQVQKEKIIINLQSNTITRKQVENEQEIVQKYEIKSEIKPSIEEINQYERYID